MGNFIPKQDNLAIVLAKGKIILSCPFPSKSLAKARGPAMGRPKNRVKRAHWATQPTMLIYCSQVIGIPFF